MRGFGYLIPQSVPFEQNVERALGVVFGPYARDTAPGTKLTVMLGGHWWDGWHALPTDDEAVAMAKAVLARHLRIPVDGFAYTAVVDAPRCIPQYTLGHADRVADLHAALRREHQGRLRVVSTDTHGIAVHDCTLAAWDVVQSLKGGGWQEDRTGLERQVDARPWAAHKAILSMAHAMQKDKDA